MKLYRLREEDRQFLYSMLYATGIILFWRGIWEVSYDIPLLKNVYFCLFVGLFILTMTGYLYREYDVFREKSRRVSQVLHEVFRVAKKEPHTVYYYDDIKGDEHTFSPKKIKKIETDVVVFEENGHEVFIPIHRITRVHKGKEVLWRR
ncbi:DUF504 domain-containing protein [Candidatus Woesearchaeota archaeon]|nr:DUF504 domain-containing protein [Candidatus Woesearchaeota archaeon]